MQPIRENRMSPEFAKSVVKTCLRVKKADKVTISTWQHTLDLAEALAIECRREGAFTETTLSTDEVFYDTLLNRPLENLRTTDPFGLALLDIATARIIIDGPENPERMKTVPTERWDAIFKAGKPFTDKYIQKKTPSIDIQLGLVTPQRAKTYGFNYNDWKASVDAALEVEYEEMSRMGKKIRSLLEEAREVDVSAGLKTRLTFRLEDRPVRLYDGVIDEEDIAKGLTFASLPAGSVSVSPNETSANGTFVSDIPQPQYGKLIHDISWSFKDGKLTAFNGGRNVEAVKATWEKATGDKEKIASFTLGINPKAKTGFLDNSIVLGTATIGIGENRVLGGKNNSSWGFGITTTRPTVKLDGKIILKDGKFTV
jgi:leucyl aminopeptidase (aminopeptidase T)